MKELFHCYTHSYGHGAWTGITRPKLRTRSKTYKQKSLAHVQDSKNVIEFSTNGIVYVSSQSLTIRLSERVREEKIKHIYYTRDHKNNE